MNDYICLVLFRLTLSVIVVPHKRNYFLFNTKDQSLVCLSSLKEVHLQRYCRGSNAALFLDGSIVASSASSSHWRCSPLHNEAVCHLLHGVIPCVQQLLGPLLPHAVKPGLVQLSYACVILWPYSALRLVELLNLLEEFLWVLTR